MNIENSAQQYLSQYYTAEFVIVNVRRLPSGGSPIPSIFSTYHYELEVVSSQFPEEIFNLYYRRELDTGKWSWSDNYYTLLLYDEAQKYFSKIVEEYFETGYLVNFIWGATPWPDGTGEATSFSRWLEAGGRIACVNVYLRERQLDKTCQLLAEEILSTSPSIGKVVINSLASEGFDQASSKTVSEIWKEESSWCLEHLYFLQQGIREEE